jgi:hypothetical protein
LFWRAELGAYAKEVRLSEQLGAVLFAPPVGMYRESDSPSNQKYAGKRECRTAIAIGKPRPFPDTPKPDRTRQQADNAEKRF